MTLKFNVDAIRHPLLREKPSVIGAVNGVITGTGLVAITPV